MTSVLEQALATVKTYCDSRVPEDLRDEIKVECAGRGNSITIVERRPPWNPELIGADWTSVKVAQLRHHGETGTWSLYHADSNSRWIRHERIGPAASPEPLLREIEQDPTGIFWG